MCFSITKLTLHNVEDCSAEDDSAEDSNTEDYNVENSSADDRSVEDRVAEMMDNYNVNIMALEHKVLI